MNKSLYIVTALGAVVDGLTGYTMLERSTSSVHTAGDGHTEAKHVESNLQDDKGLPAHDASGTTTNQPQI